MVPVIQLKNNGKIVEADNAHVELFKYLENNGLIVLTDLFHAIYHSGMKPKEWLKSFFILILKNTRLLSEMNIAPSV